MQTLAAPTATITLQPELLAAIAETDPDTVAVKSGGFELTNRELDSWSNRVARLLLGLGAAPDANVVIALSPSVESVVTVWAATKIGATVTTLGTDGDVHTIGRTVGVTTKAHRRTLTDKVTWLVLDDRSTVVRYLAGSDAPITEADRRAAESA